MEVLPHYGVPHIPAIHAPCRAESKFWVSLLGYFESVHTRLNPFERVVAEVETGKLFYYAREHKWQRERGGGLKARAGLLVLSYVPKLKL